MRGRPRGQSALHRIRAPLIHRPTTTQLRMNLPLSKSLSELPEYRFVLANLIARDLKVRYQDKALGFLWSLLHPALLLGIWYLVFSHVVRIDIGGPRYWAFLLPGLLA